MVANAGGATTERVIFAGPEGQQLSGRMELPVDGRVRGCALFAHCFTCGQNARAAVDLSRALTRRGIAVLRFDFTGLGDSEGQFAETGFVSNVADLVAAARFMGDTYESPSLLVGHSLGGPAVIRAALELDSVRAVVTIGAPADPGHAERQFAGALEEIEAAGSADVVIGHRTVRIGRQLLEEIRASPLDDALRRLRVALLIMHAPRDTIVGVEHARRLYDLATHPKSFVALDGADHLLSDPRDSDYAAGVIAAWAERYLPPVEEPTVKELIETEDVVVSIGRERFRTEVQARAHGLLADEPKVVGGTDAGPTPYDLLLAALGTCTAMTLRMYADRKKWPLDGVRVRLTHGHVHALDDQQVEDGDPRTDAISRLVELSGTLDPEMRQRLMEIADRCPVHRTLTAGVRITTSTDPDSG
jgi:uncharacterized OsmC-like protein/pimeloyl-ACP methyl ester carboxylesterase